MRPSAPPRSSPRRRPRPACSSSRRRTSPSMRGETPRSSSDWMLPLVDLQGQGAVGRQLGRQRRTSGSRAGTGGPPRAGPPGAARSGPGPGGPRPRRRGPATRPARGARRRGRPHRRACCRPSVPGRLQQRLQQPPGPGLGQPLEDHLVQAGLLGQPDASATTPSPCRLTTGATCANNPEPTSRRTMVVARRASGFSGLAAQEPPHLGLVQGRQPLQLHLPQGAGTGPPRRRSPPRGRRRRPRSR